MIYDIGNYNVLYVMEMKSINQSALIEQHFHLQKK